MNMVDCMATFRAAIVAALGFAPEVIEPGRLHRFPTREKRGDDAGWCKLFEDMRGGVFGCNRAGISETWRADDGRAMTREQRAELARQVAEGIGEDTEHAHGNVSTHRSPLM